MTNTKRSQQKMTRKQILRSQMHSRNDLLKRKKQHVLKQKLTFDITYNPAFQKVRSTMEELHYFY